MQERRTKAVSIAYLASILQPRSLAELGSDATMKDLLTGIVKPMVEQGRGTGANDHPALVDTLNDNVDVVGTATVAVSCPLSCSFLGLVQALISWTTANNRNPKHEFAWIGCFSTDLWLADDVMARYTYLADDYPNVINGIGKLIILNDPCSLPNEKQKVVKRQSKWSKSTDETPVGLRSPACYTDALCLFELFQALEEDVGIHAINSPAEKSFQRAELANHGVHRLLRSISNIKVDSFDAQIAEKIHEAGSARLMQVSVRKFLCGSVIVNAESIMNFMVNRAVKFGQHVGGQGWSRIRPLVITGPPGCRKAELMAMLMDKFPAAFGAATRHTNLKEPAEEQLRGADDLQLKYHYTSRDVMISMKVDGDFVEWRMADNIIYGSSRAAVAKLAKNGKICILDVPVKSVDMVCAARLDPAPIIVYLKPPSIDDARQRLRQENPDMTEAEMETGMEIAAADFSFLSQKGKSDMFDEVILDDDVVAAFESLQVHLTDDMQKAALVRQHNFSQTGVAMGVSNKDAQQPEHFSPEKLFNSIARMCNQLSPELLKITGFPSLQRPAEKARVAAIEGYKANRLIHGDYVHEGLATAVFNMGLCLAAENSEENLKFCRKALKMRIALHGHVSEAVAESHMVLGGHCELLLMDFERSMRHWEEALRIYQEKGQTWTMPAADCMFNIGCIKGKQNNHKAMRTDLTKAVRVYKHLLGEDHPTTLRTLNSLAATKAKIACLEGNHARASQIFERASIMYVNLRDACVWPAIPVFEAVNTMRYREKGGVELIIPCVAFDYPGTETRGGGAQRWWPSTRKSCGAGALKRPSSW